MKGVKTLFSAEIWFSADRRRWPGVQDLPANPDDRIYAPYALMGAQALAIDARSPAAVYPR